MTKIDDEPDTSLRMWLAGTCRIEFGQLELAALTPDVPPTYDDNDQMTEAFVLWQLRAIARMRFAYADAMLAAAKETA